MTKIVIREIGDLQMHRGSFGPSHAEFEYGPLAIDAIGHATAEDLLVELRMSMSEAHAQMVVGILLEADLTFDSTIDVEVV